MSAESPTPLQWILITTFLITVIPMVIGGWKYRALNQESKAIFWLAVVTFLLDAPASYLFYHAKPNLFIGHIFTPLEFLFIVYIYRRPLKSLIPEKWNTGLMVVIALLAIGNTLFLQGIKENNTNIRTLESVLLILFSLLYFFQLARNLSVIHLEREPFFWFNTGVLLYFSGNAFIFLYSNYILKYSQDLGIKVYLIHNFFFVLFYLFCSIALWNVQKK